MLTIQLVDIGGTIKPSVENHLDLLLAQGVHVGQQFGQRLDVGNVSGQFQVIKGQS